MADAPQELHSEGEMLAFAFKASLEWYERGKARGRAETLAEVREVIGTLGRDHGWYTEPHEIIEALDRLSEGGES